jgi:hypothetical protein
MTAGSTCTPTAKRPSATRCRSVRGLPGPRITVPPSRTRPSSMRRRETLVTVCALRPVRSAISERLAPSAARRTASRTTVRL